MANLFVNIPVPAANGAGAPVDVSAMGKTKSFVCGGGFRATVNVEYSTDAGGLVWAPLATFQQAGNLTIDVAAHWLRAVTSSYVGGAPNLDVGANDAGALFALLPAAGTPVDISALPLFKTVIVPNGVPAIIEVSEDGVSWAQIFSLPNGGAVSRPVYGQFARISGGVDATIAAANDGSGGGVASRLLSIYGDGSFGDHTTAGDEQWTVSNVPGAPVVPTESPIPYAFFNNLTISPGDSVAVGSEGENAVVIFVKGKLLIGAGGRIHANGFPGLSGTYIDGAPGGAGRKAIVGSVDGGAGGTGGFGGLSRANGNGDPGLGGARRPAQATATMIGGSGGDATGNPGFFTGGAGGECEADASWPYSLAIAFSVASLLTQIGGGNGGGGGAGAGSSGFGGGGGGGAGTLVIFANEIEAPDGSIQAIGGAGGNGHAIESVASSGGGGATGGTIIVVTENLTLIGICDASGGAGGAADGNNSNPGTAGGPGEAIAFNPMLAAQIPT